MLRWLGTVSDGYLAIDSETTGLDFKSDRVRLVQIGSHTEAWAIPLDTAISWGGLVQQVLTQWDGKYIAHNSVYDWAMMAVSGFHIPWSRIHDTRLMAAVLEPDQSNALKRQAARHVDRKAAGAQSQLSEVMAKHGWTWGTIPIVADHAHPASIYWVYGALDTILTRHLFDVHYPVVQAQCPAAYDLELAVSKVCHDMSDRGVLCDRAFTQGKYDAFTSYVQQSYDYCLAEYGFAPTATREVVEYLRAAGLHPHPEPWPKYTPGGAYSLDREVLEPLADRHPLAALILKRRRAEKVASSFLSGFLKYSESDGRLRPRINSVGGSGKSQAESGGDYGVRTGRMSLDSPNLSALPRVGDGNPVADVVRNCIVADDGHSFILSDLDQIEVRLLAHFTSEQGMKDALAVADAGGADFFTSLARQLYSDPSIERKSPLRSVTKSATYATSYGAGVNKFAATSHLSTSDASAFMNRFHATYPGLRRHMRVLEEQIRQQGFVASPLTGRRHRPDEGYSYKALNYLIQGTASEIFKMQILELDATDAGQYLVLPVHDELTLCVPDEELADMAKIVHSVMNNDQLLSVPITAGVATAKRWGTKTEFAL